MVGQKIALLSRIVFSFEPLVIAKIYSFSLFCIY